MDEKVSADVMLDGSSTAEAVDVDAQSCVTGMRSIMEEEGWRSSKMPVAERAGKCNAVSNDVCTVNLLCEFTAYLKCYPISSSPFPKVLPMQRLDDPLYAATPLHLRLMADRRCYWKQEAKTDDLKGT
jgi:hypothetical protein